jgi:hypothetical protein
MRPCEDTFFVIQRLLPDVVVADVVVAMVVAAVVAVAVVAMVCPGREERNHVDSWFAEGKMYCAVDGTMERTDKEHVRRPRWFSRAYYDVCGGDRIT